MLRGSFVQEEAQRLKKERPVDLKASLSPSQGS